MSKQTIHTPGPWIVDSGTDSIENMADCLLRSKGMEQEWIAVGIADEDGYAESVAYCHPINAHLIAAAPEMFSELEKCKEAFETLKKWGQVPMHVVMLQYGINEIDNILAKAKGVA